MAWKTKKNVKKKPRVLKKAVIKPFNHGTMTTAAFFGMIRSSLRQKSRWWVPIAEAKKLARRKFTGLNKRQRWEYQCNHCKKWYKDDDVAVDHIIEAGSLNKFEDLAGFAQRLFCEVDGFQVLCNECHNIKTNEYKQRIKDEKQLAEH